MIRRVEFDALLVSLAAEAGVELVASSASSAVKRIPEGYAYMFPKRDHVNVGIGYMLSYFRAAVDAAPRTGPSAAAFWRGRPGSPANSCWNGLGTSRECNQSDLPVCPLCSLWLIRAFLILRAAPQGCRLFLELGARLSALWRRRSARQARRLAARLFGELAFDASAHHERLDGKGYYRNLAGAHLSPAARILATPDQLDAQSAERPYRGTLPPDKVMAIMRDERGTGLDSDCVTAAEMVFTSGNLSI